MSTYLPQRGDIAEYTFDPATHGVIPDQTVTGDVLAVGKTYADVRWHTSNRVERIRFRNPDGVTFKPANAD